MFTLPLGCRFLPTDEELICGYLLARVMGRTLPYDIIWETNLYGQHTHPCDVFRGIDESNPWYWQSDDHETKGVTKKNIYVFTKLVKAGPNSSRIARRAGSGTWSGQTGARMIKNSNGEIIGSRKMFTFQDSTTNEGVYHWIMHEYSLDGVYKNLGRNNINNNLVLCKITRSFKGKSTNNIESNGSIDEIPQSVNTVENNGNLDQIPQPVETFENNGSLNHISQLVETIENSGDLDQIPQPMAIIENIGDGYSFPNARINGGGDDQIPQPAAAIDDNGDGYNFPTACSNEGGFGQIPQPLATIEINGDGYCFCNACIYGGGMDQTLQSSAAMENNIEALPWSLCGQKRPCDEDAVRLLEECEREINPKKPRKNDDILEVQMPLTQYSETIDTDDLFEGLPDFESLKSLADFETDI